MLLVLDLSSTSTGWALFDPTKEKPLMNYGVLKPNTKGQTKLGKLKRKLYRLRDMARQCRELIDTHKPDRIVIEEVNLGKNRISQKTLDGLHFILLDRIEDVIDLVVYKDSDGPVGWRTDLELRLTEDDKRLNKTRRAWNKKLPKGARQLPIITKKHLACRFVNKAYRTAFDVDKNKADSDVCDAIGLGHAIVHFHLTFD